jgi:hypothetical protein
MRVALVTLALLSLASAAAAEAPAAPHATPTAAPDAPAPRAQIENPSHHAGKVDQGTTVRHSFLIKNIGTAELSVDAKPG